jgi:anaphase-promoting complex subunit 4
MVSLVQVASNIVGLISLGQSIALAHDPPRVSIHSVQDGKEERSLVLQSMPDPNTTLQNLWWFTSPQPFQDTQIPDVFQRNGIIVSWGLHISESGNPVA